MFKACRICCENLDIRGFPVFCGLLVALSNLLHSPAELLRKRISPLNKCRQRRGLHRTDAFVARFLSTLIAAYSTLSLLQLPGRKGLTAVGSGDLDGDSYHVPKGDSAVPAQRSAIARSKDEAPLAGLTIDLSMSSLLHCLVLLYERYVTHNTP